MKQPRLMVVSGAADLIGRLAEACPDLTISTESGGASIAVIDVDRYETVSEVDESLCRIILTGERPPPGPRRRGDLRVSREEFLRDPSGFVMFCLDLVEKGTEAGHLRQELGFLEHIQELTRIADSGAMSERITRTVLDILGLPFGTLLLHDPKIERYVVSFSNDPEHRDTGEFVPGMPTLLLQKALNSERGLSLEPPSANAGGLIVIPIEIEEDMIGVLKIPIASGTSFDEALADRAAHYVGMVTSVLGNVYQLTRSKDLAMRDDLTRAFNRRFFDSYLDEEIERARRYGMLFSIIFLDLDDLKLVNNLYGHLTGSRTLQEVAKRILGAVRAIDKVVRFGGDEFCIILPQTDQEQARAVATRVQRAIAGAVFRVEPEIEVSITASFGIASYPLHARSKEELIRRADSAMYRVKSTTKNAVGIADIPVAPIPEETADPRGA